MMKRAVFWVITVAISLLLVVTFGEIFSRFFKQDYLSPEDRQKQSPRYATALFAQEVFPQKVQTLIGWHGVEWYINQKGYRGSDFPLKPADGVVRVIFYGGSSVFDLALPEGQDWPHRVGTLLTQSGFEKIEVINAGIPGNASIDSVGKLLTEGHTFEPDFVVLYNAWNDIKLFNLEGSLLRELRPHRPKRDPRLNYRGRLDRILSNWSQLYITLRQIYYTWTLDVGLEGRKPKGIRSHGVKLSGLEQYRLNVETFVDLARNIGATPILMTQIHLTTRNNVSNVRAHDAIDDVLLTFDALAEAFDKTDEIIREVGKSKGVLVVDASKAFSGIDELLLDQVHLTPEGSEKLARMTASHMAKLLREAGLGSPVQKCVLAETRPDSGCL